MPSSPRRVSPGSRVRTSVVLVTLSLGSLLPAGALAQEPSAAPLITDLRVEQEGRVVTDPALLSLIETTPGKPLSRVDVRESSSHLAGLNRFEDVQPWTEPTPNGVRIVYRLIPLRPIDKLEFEGNLGLSEGDLRSAVRESLGTSLAINRIETAKGVLRQRYFDKGYDAAQIDHQLVPRTNPDRSTLLFTIDAGMRAIVRKVVVEPQDPQEVLVGLPAIRAGRPYDLEEISQTLQKYVDTMRRNGYYEARAEPMPEFTSDGVNLRVVVHRGPRVQVVFTGDPLTKSEQQRLVPVRAQASVDEDLLENASLDIERYLRERGYREARAPYNRPAAGQEQTITFDVMRGPLYQVGEIRFVGVENLSEEELRRALRFKSKGAFIEGVVVADAYEIEQKYRTAGFNEVKVTPVYATVTPETATEARRVDVTLTISEGPKFVVGSVSFTGNTAISEAELLDLVQIKEGDPLNGRRIEEGRLLLEARYKDLGFESVQVQPPAVTTVDNRVNLGFSIAEGMQVFIDRIIIDGNERTRRETIERELRLHPGDPMGASNRIRSEANLRALGLFRRVRIEERRHTGDDRVDVVVRVEEAPRTTIGYGGGVEISERLRPVELGRRRAARVRASRLFRGGTAESLGRHPIGQSLHACQPENARRSDHSRPSRYVVRCQRVPRARYLPRTARTGHACGDARNRHRRTGHPAQLHLRDARGARRSGPSGVSRLQRVGSLLGQEGRSLRRRSESDRRAEADRRSPLPAGAVVEAVGFTGVEHARQQQRSNAGRHLYR